MADVFTGAVCKIEIVEDDGGVSVMGTGFHYGNGWVITNAHNLQRRGDKHNQHSNLDRARLTFPIGTVFEPRRRVAFIHHLKPGPNANVKVDIDIGMIKLGPQYEFNRPQNKWEDWERQEHVLLQDIPTMANLEAPTLVKGHSAKAIYPVLNTGEIKHVACVIDTVLESNNNIIQLSADPVGSAPWPLPAGSSGCIVSVRKAQGSEEFLLAAVHFAGSTNAGVSYALSVIHGAGKNYIEKGRSIIDNIGQYLCYQKLGIHGKERVDEARARLDKLERENSLRIYIPYFD